MAESLEQRIKRHIQMNGPLPLAEYMHWCLFDAKAGYYTNRQGIGPGGDFITAPEVSQMFGELVGLWLYKNWQALGSPDLFNLVELGPGNGTLMLDVLRTTANFPKFNKAAQIWMVETSPTLRKQQSETLKAQSQIHWCSTIDEVPDAPSLFIANEFLDALPLRQYVKSGAAWAERCVGLDENDNLCWVLGPGSISEDLLPPAHKTEPDGAVYEASSPREAFVIKICERIKLSKGTALLIDYGHSIQGFGDTFQALYEHKFADPLTNPGKCDLTSHVDFAPLRNIALDLKLNCPPIISQGEFLINAGLLERAGQLGHNKDTQTQSLLKTQAERLALPDQMGDLFKFFAFTTLDELWLFDNTVPETGTI